jgi:hypothetical protein
VYTRFASAVATTAAITVLVACSNTKAERANARDSSAAPATAGTPATTAGANVVTITAKEYSYDAPAEIPAGLTTIRLVSAGKEVHHVSLIKLEDGKTVQDFAAAMKTPGPFPSWAVEMGGPNPPHPDGGVAEVTQVLAPGNYLLVCFVPGADGLPHVTKGMVRPITVTPSTAPAAAEPSADVTITLRDYAFDLSKPLTAGKHVIRVESDGSQPHEVVLVKLPPGKTVEDVMKWGEKPNGPPPAEFYGGMAGMHEGGHAYFDVDLTPGNYGLLCFLPDAKDGKPHIAHGMFKQLTVS